MSKQNIHLNKKGWQVAGRPQNNSGTPKVILGADRLTGPQSFGGETL